MSIRVNIKKSFGTFVLDVAFEAGNDVVGLLGASGCGKSMTLKCIAGVVRPDEGRISLDGTVLFDSARGIDLPPRKRRVGLLFQSCALFPNMTVEQNILSVLFLNRRTNRLAALVEQFRLGGLERLYPAQLSGGQQQRAALARIVASEPAILMLDEPFSALDSYLRWQLEGELMQILDEFGGTALYVSHSRDEVYRLCSRVCVMDRGRGEALRTVRELFEAPDTLASSLLSGCKNYSRAERTKDGRPLDTRSVLAADWNVVLRCKREVSPDVGYIGVRAHHVVLRTGNERRAENVFSCRVLRVVEDVFSTFVNLQPVHLQSVNAPEGERSRIRMEFPKRKAETLRPGDVVSVEIEPEHVMLLRD